MFVALPTSQSRCFFEWPSFPRLRRCGHEAEKLDEQPYVQEMTLIEQTVAFCKSLTTTKEVGEKKEEKEIKHDLAEGVDWVSAGGLLRQGLLFEVGSWPEVGSDACSVFWFRGGPSGPLF